MLSKRGEYLKRESSFGAYSRHPTLRRVITPAATGQGVLAPLSHPRPDVTPDVTRPSANMRLKQTHTPILGQKIPALEANGVT